MQCYLILRNETHNFLIYELFLDKIFIMRPHRFEVETILKKPITDVFDFFSQAKNLDLLTPPELEFKIITPLPIQMKAGIFIDYRLKLHGIPFLWKTEITCWEPPFRFIDKQVKGPYRIWNHEHCFVETSEGTLMTDIVEYLAPGLFLEPIIQKLYIRKKVESIFAFRRQKLLNVF